MPEINIQATVGVCTEFVGADGIEKELSVVISPTHVDMLSQDRMKVVTGCNMWKSCNNPNCYYSIAARQRKRP